MFQCLQQPKLRRKFPLHFENPYQSKPDTSEYYILRFVQFCIIFKSVALTTFSSFMCFCQLGSTLSHFAKFFNDNLILDVYCREIFLLVLDYKLQFNTISAQTLQKISFSSKIYLFICLNFLILFL